MRLKELLAFNDIVIQCHDFPDADAIAAGYALLTYLRDNGKTPRLVYAGNKKITKPSLILMTEDLGIPLEYVTEIAPPDLLVTVDCVFSEMNVTTLPAKRYASIDHHKINSEINDLVEVRSNYGSCSAVIAKMLEEESVDYNSRIDVATALYYGLYMDTNGFSEIYHPADKDLRDFAIYDTQLLQLLKNSNLTLEELAIAGDAIKSVYHDTQRKFALTEARPCDPNVLGVISDLLIQVEKVEVCVVCSKAFRHGIKYSVRSITDDMRADELAKIIAEDVGNGGGHLKKAGGFIRTHDLNDDNIMNFLINRIISAYDSYKTLYSDQLDLSKLNVKRYKKLPQVLGYISTTDILPAGGKICVRTLKSDCNIISGKMTLIVITNTGSVFPLDKESFLSQYIPSDEPFEFSVEPEYIPHIIGTESNHNIALSGNIMRFAKKCRSRDDISFHAHQLTENIKLYKKWDKMSYIVGQTGDYLTFKDDDPDYIHIVDKKQFEKEYGEC